MVTGTVTWQQQAEGRLDVTQRIINAFHDQGSFYGWAFALDDFGGGGGGLIQCLCGDGLKSDWPRAGTSIGAGWSLTTGTDATGLPLCYITDGVTDSQTAYVLNYEGQAPPPAPTGGQTQDQSNVNVYLNPYGTFTGQFPLNVYKIRMTLDYRANRKRVETVTAVVTAAVQRELSDSADSDRETISLNSEFVDKGVDPGGTIPIGNVAYRSYFQTARGATSFEYLLLAARAKMRARARAVDVTFAVPWQDALGITLRNSVSLTDRRLPGGAAVGKVKSYKLSFGTGGVMLGEFTIGCSIGTGAGIAPQAGVNAYVDNPYVDLGYQAVTGSQIAIGGTDEIAYQTLDDFVVSDDGLDLTHPNRNQMVNECIVTNGLIVQLGSMSQYQDSLMLERNLGNPIEVMRELSTTVTLDLKPLQGAEFDTAFFPAVTPLKLPKTIDLSAPPGG
jgi:hypothetical protein